MNNHKQSGSGQDGDPFSDSIMDGAYATPGEYRQAAPRRSWLRRAWSGFWGFVEGTRRMFFNILFLLLLYFLIKLIFSSSDSIKFEQDSALILNPRGAVVEEYSGTPFERLLGDARGTRQPETQLRDLIEALKAAKSDKKINAVIIDTDQLTSLGMAAALDLELAINDYKSSGKPIVAVADNLLQPQYLLAAMADEVWLNSEGIVWIDGFARYRNFYKEALDKLEVEVNLFRVGEYKSAMEPYIRNDMSEQAKEANLYWINGLWQQYLETVARHRGVPLEDLSQSVAELPEKLALAKGSFAEYALNAGLVDKLVSRPQVRNELAQITAVDEEDGYRQIEMQDYLYRIRQLELPSSAKKVAVVVAEGDIVQGEQAPGTIGADSTAQKIRQAAAKTDVAALVLRVNSPGGDAFASEVVRRELQAARDAGKPVVVSMGDVAASGGYWISMAADQVWASPTTITGSIGIFGMIPTFPQTLAKVGVYTDGIGTTPIAGSLRLDRSLPEQTKQVFQTSVERGYDDFISLVAQARDMRPEAVDAIARGRVWSGSQAQERGLVDQLGGLQAATDAAARIAGLGANYTVKYIEEELTGADRLVAGLVTKAVTRFNTSSNGIQRLNRLPWVARLIGDLEFIAENQQRFALHAHCLCNVQ